MAQVFIHYSFWEDYINGMWRNIYGQERDEYLNKAIKFTGNYRLYGKWMLSVIKEWHYACLHNLTNTAINQQAFIGHCACSMAIGCPEDITRIAWHTLTKKQQDNANLKADYAIMQWNEKYLRGYQPCLRLDWE
jgi:hypothetical protein